MKKLVKAILSLCLLVSLTACGGSKEADDKVIRVGATVVPHAMILNDVVKEVLAEAGWTLEVIEFTDYVQPNTQLEEGTIDANYFQTLGYLNDQNQANGLHLVPAAGVHYEPMQIFSKNYTSIDQVQDGDEITFPNDIDNGKRALCVARDAGLIEFDPDLVDKDHDFVDGITSNPKNLKFTPVEAAMVANTNDDAALLIINGNYALESKIKDKSNSIFVEVPDIAARTNYLVVKEGNENTEKTKALVEAITNPKVKEYIIETYGSAVICVFD